MANEMDAAGTDSSYNRYSMPVTRSRTGLYGADLDQTGTARFLFGEDDAGDAKYGNGQTDDHFPTLVRREDQMLSASSAALDLALSPSPVPDASSTPTGWSSINRHRARQSLSTINTSQLNGSSSGDIASIGSSRPSSVRHSIDLKYFSENPSDSSSVVSPTGNSVMATPPQLQSSFSANDVPTVKSGPSTTNNHAQQHFHNHNASIGRIPAGAVPTRHSRELSGDSNIGGSREQTGPYHSIQSALQASAAPFGPAGGNTNQAPATPFGPAGGNTNQAPATPFGPAGGNANQSPATPFGPAGGNANQSPATPLGPAGGNVNQSPANPFGPVVGNANQPPAAATPQPASASGPTTNPPNAAISSPTGMNSACGYYNNGGAPAPAGFVQPPVTSGAPMAGVYGLPQLAMSMQGMNLNNAPAYSAQNYVGFGNLYTPPTPPSKGPNPGHHDSQARIIAQRRQMDGEPMLRYQNLPLEAIGGEIYIHCKDQHGCRYLQRQLEERNPDHVHMIWLETNAHVVELMTDPFGNYLCQKLLEYCNDEERTVLVQNAAQDMVRIALNQHGTRALQKMIEHITTPNQVALIIGALRNQVVELIQDLNGNHVIQKCLNKLTSPNAQFIFDAVGNNCVNVGTHRHGCCVLQRCIDHADGQQKVWLIGRITEHAPTLVQDPFGNYVVQYIIDLNESAFTEPIVGMFRNRISQLSRHKFSSNVIEKCLRCSLDQSRDMIVEELLSPGEIDRLLRDSFANYVIQTALEYATPNGKYRLVEAIRPFLPTIRSTPYGRRIQAKIAAFDNRGAAVSSGQVTPADNTGGQIPLRSGRNLGMVHNTSILANGAPAPNTYTAPINGNARNNGPTYPMTSNLTVAPPTPSGQGQGQPQQGQPQQGQPQQGQPQQGQHVTPTNYSSGWNGQGQAQTTMSPSYVQPQQATTNGVQGHNAQGSAAAGSNDETQWL